MGRSATSAPPSTLTAVTSIVTPPSMRAASTAPISKPSDTVVVPVLRLVVCLKIQVEFNPATVLEYRLIGYENRMLAREDFNNDKVDAGDIGAGHRVTALYEIVPVGKSGRLDPLRYGPQAQPLPRATSSRIVKLRYKKPQSDTSELLEYPIGKGSVATLERLSPDFRFAASVAAFGQLLRGGKYVGNYGYGDVERLARGALDDDPRATVANSCRW